jgi:hypothetical protein
MKKIERIEKLKKIKKLKKRKFSVFHLTEKKTVNSVMHSSHLRKTLPARDSP